MLELVTSVRFYCRSKTRALSCALLCGMATAEDGRAIRVCSYTDFDLYLQNYFVHIYQLIDSHSAPNMSEDDETSYLELNKVYFKDLH